MIAVAGRATRIDLHYTGQQMKLRRARSWMASKMRVVFLIMFISLLNLSALFSAVALSDSVESKSYTVHITLTLTLAHEYHNMWMKL